MGKRESCVLKKGASAVRAAEGVLRLKLRGVATKRIYERKLPSTATVGGLVEADVGWRFCAVAPKNKRALEERSNHGKGWQVVLRLRSREVCCQEKVLKEAKEERQKDLGG